MPESGIVAITVFAEGIGEIVSGTPAMEGPGVDCSSDECSFCNSTTEWILGSAEFDRSATLSKTTMTVQLRRAFFIADGEVSNDSTQWCRFYEPMMRGDCEYSATQGSTSVHCESA